MLVRLCPSGDSVIARWVPEKPIQYVNGLAPMLKQPMDRLGAQFPVLNQAVEAPSDLLAGIEN